MVRTRVPFKVGDKVNLSTTKRAWTVRGVTTGGRFVILTQPFNPRRAVLYTVVDFDRGVRGKDDHYGLGYESDEQVADALACFQRTEDGYRLPDGSTLGADDVRADVSFRSGNHVRLDFTAINGSPCEWDGTPP